MSFEREQRGSGGDFTSDGVTGSPGKRTRSEGLPVQRQASGATPILAGESPAPAAEDPFGVHLLGGDVVQRKIAAPTAVQRSTLPGADEVIPAATGKDKPVAKLHFLVDIDVKSLGIKDLTSGRVGHTWISIEYLDPHAVPDTVPGNHKALLENGGKYADPMGFWPDTENGIYYNPNPFKSWVQGKMRNPDRAHEGAEKAMQTWMINQAEVDAVIKYAESKQGSKYSVYFFNCTTFAAEAVGAAGKSAPASSTAGICFPNAAYDGIKANQDKGKGTTWTKDLETGEETSASGPDGKAG